MASKVQPLHRRHSGRSGRIVLSPLRYPGGKRRLVPYVAEALRINGLRPGLFVEPYAGGASVALELLHGGAVERIALADADPMVAAFWQTVFEDHEWLCRQVESITVDVATWERMKRARWRSRRSLALACLFLNRTSFNGALHRRAGPIGGKAQAGDYDLGCRFPRARLVDRIKGCAALADRVEFVLRDDAMQAVRDARVRARRSGWTLFFYFDPPFWAKSQRLYRRSFSETDHEALAEAMWWVREPYLLSYDPAAEIAELYAPREGLRVEEIELFYTGSGHAPGRKPAGRELVISNLERLPPEGKLWRTSAEWRELRRALRRSKG